jgi:hypothetical protein
MPPAPSHRPRRHYGLKARKRTIPVTTSRLKVATTSFQISAVCRCRQGAERTAWLRAPRPDKACWPVNMIDMMSSPIPKDTWFCSDGDTDAARRPFRRIERRRKFGSRHSFGAGDGPAAWKGRPAVRRRFVQPRLISSPPSVVPVQFALALHKVRTRLSRKSWSKPASH